MALVCLACVIVVLAGYGVALTAVWQRTREPTVLCSLVLTAYWTLLGAIPVILAKWRSSDERYSYLEDRLFVLRLDGTYLLTIVIYGAFLLGSAVLVLVAARPRSKATVARDKAGFEQLASRLVHGRVVGWIAAGTVTRIALLMVAVRAQGTGSLYEATRIVRGPAAMFIYLYQYVNIVTVYPLAVAIGVWIALPSSRPRNPTSRVVLGAGYAALGLVVLAENALVGNRAVLLVALGAVFVLYLRLRFQVSRGRLRARLLWRLGLAGFFALVGIGAVGISRGGQLTTPGAVAGSLASNLGRVGNVIIQETRSSEKLAAHMSLYGVLQHPGADPQPLIGNSYATYATLVNAPPDQVFTIHYVTSWWLRLGPLGIVGAIATFGGIISVFSRFAAPLHRGLFRSMVSLTAGSLPAVGLPVVVVRSGPEALRSVVVELVVLPAIVLAVCSTRGPSGSRAASVPDAAPDARSVAPELSRAT